MEAKKVVVQKEIEVVTKKLVDEETFTLILTAEEASELRTLSYTVGYELVKDQNTTAHVIFKNLFNTLCMAGVPHAKNNGMNFQQDFREFS